MRDVPQEHIFKVSGSAAAGEFCEWVQVEIEKYIPHHKYEVKPHSSPWFWAACAISIVHRIHQQNKSFWSKVKLRQASNCSKYVLEAVKLVYINKTKESTSQKCGFLDFRQIANSVPNKGKSAIPLLFNGPEVLSSPSDKAKLFVKPFLRTLFLLTQVSIYLLFLL